MTAATPASPATARSDPEVSVVIPVYNEAEGLPELFVRLYPALDALALDYECLFVDDGSTDRSAALLREQFARRPGQTRVIFLQTNFGQHAAILAGFKMARGRRLITLDADLQNPPEEIGRLLAKLDEGYDYVGAIRRQRQDRAWRRLASRLMNHIRERITHIRMTDHGCMLRAYDRSVVDAVNNTREINTFIPAIAYLYALHPVEIEVTHSERHSGQSKYSFYRLLRLNFDLITGFSIVPLQFFAICGLLLSAASALLVGYLALRRIFLGPEVEGVFTLFGITFFLIGILLFGIGLLGEYVGRIYQEVRDRPRYLIRGILEQQDVSS